MHTLRNVTLLLLLFSSLVSALARDPESLDIISDEYPRAFFSQQRGCSQHTPQPVVRIMGKHDWNQCEQVQLIAVDTEANTIRVRRACYETKPLAFSAESARTAVWRRMWPTWAQTSVISWQQQILLLSTGFKA